MLGILGTLVFRSAVAGFSYGVGGVWYIRNTLSYFGNKTLVLWEQMFKIARPEQRLNNDFTNTRVCVTTLTQYLTIVTPTGRQPQKLPDSLNLITEETARCAPGGLALIEKGQGGSYQKQPSR